LGRQGVPHGEAKWRAMLAKVLSRVTVLDFTYDAASRAPAKGTY